MLEGEDPGIPALTRAWAVTNVAKAFGVLPSAAARDLENDPEQLSLFGLTLLRYYEAKEAADTNDPKVYERWQGSTMFQRVLENQFAMAAGVGEENAEALGD